MIFKVIKSFWREKQKIILELIFPLQQFWRNFYDETYLSVCKYHAMEKFRTILLILKLISIFTDVNKRRAQGN
jgi:hypothetical protein